MRSLAVSLIVFAACLNAQTASPAYVQHNLVSDIPNLADFTDPGLVNPWGIAFSATGPFWLTDTATGLSTVYAGNGAINNAIRVTVPAAAGPNATGRPTGILFSSTGFALAPGKNASFIFCSLDGTISGWNSTVDPAHSVIMIDNSASGARYEGCGMAATDSGPQIYAPNFNSGNIDVYDANWAPVTLPAGAFTDSQVPQGFGPYNVQNLNGKLYVTYAMQDANKRNGVPGAGAGHVAVFDTSGKLLSHLISGGPLNAPWGLVIAGPNFGAYSNDLLVGNFGNGIINAFDPTSGAFLGPILNARGTPFVNIGLWALIMGNGGNGGDANALYFAAGISGPTGAVQSHGLFGSIQAPPVLAASAIVNGGSFQAGLAPNTWTTISGPNLASTTRDWTADIVDGKLPTMLDGVSVMVNGKPAYIGYISPKQINILTPADATTGPVQIQTTNNGLTSSSVTAAMQAASPAFFLFAGGKYIAARHADGTPVGPATLFPNSSTPAKAGETISLYGTGFGPTTPAAADGQVVAAGLPLASQPTVMVGGTVAQVMFAGLSAGSAGLYQINVTIPSGAASGDAPVVTQLGALSTQSGAMVAVQ
jgi:uncharacterized protein (TIGR03118 family)